MSPVAAFFAELGHAFLEASPYLVLGYFVAGLMKEFVSRERMTRQLGGHGVGPVARAVGAGAVLPICSCGIIPLGIGFFRNGAARGTVLAFMTSSPVISPVTVVMVLSLLGAGFLGGFAFLAIVGSLILGWAVNRITRNGPDGREATDEATAAGGVMSRGQRFWRGQKWAFFGMGSRVSVDLLIGIALAAAFRSVIPEEWVMRWLGTTSPWAMVVVTLVMLPIYTCSVPSIPVAQALLMVGAHPGVVLAYLIAGPSTNLGELNAIRGAMGVRSMGLYVAALLVLAIGGGWVFGQFYDAAVFAGDWRMEPLPVSGEEHGGGHDHGGHGVALWRIPMVALVGAVIAKGIVDKFRRG